MASRASGWNNGRNIWTVDHDGSGEPGRLEVEGEPPTLFGPIRQALEEKQQASGRDVDYLFDAPVELAKALVGFRHDEDVPGAAGDAFEVLAEPRAEIPKNGFWTRLLGR